MQKASAFAAAAFVLSPAVLLAQHPTVQVSSGRKITSQISPAYPDIAKRMHMHGTVRLQVVVGFNGSVKSSVILGGVRCLQKLPVRRSASGDLNLDRVKQKKSFNFCSRLSKRLKFIQPVCFR